MIALAFSHPSDDLTTWVTALFGVALVLWIAVTLIGRGRS